MAKYFKQKTHKYCAQCTSGQSFLIVVPMCIGHKTTRKWNKTKCYFNYKCYNGHTFYVSYVRHNQSVLLEDSDLNNSNELILQNEIYALEKEIAELNIFKNAYIANVESAANVTDNDVNKDNDTNNDTNNDKNNDTHDNLKDYSDISTDCSDDDIISTFINGIFSVNVAD